MAKAPTKKPAPGKAKPKAASKTKAKTASSGTRVPALDQRDETMSIRKISNGYIVRESWLEGTGDKQRWQERETFTKVKPSIVLPK